MRPAKITDRFLAYLVDLLPFVAAYYAALWYLIVKSGSWPNTNASWRTVGVVAGAAYLLYQAVGNSSGATVGKALFGIRVVNSEGRPLGFGRGLFRALGYLISMPLFNLGFLWAIFDADSKAWHDKLAGSLVVEVQEKSEASATGSAALSFALLAALGVGSLWSVYRTPTPKDRADIAKAEAGLEILAQIEEAYKAQHGTYTNSLVELARTSGDPVAFKASMGEIFRPTGFVLRAGKASYELSAYARDRKSTRVRRIGP